MAGQWDVLRIFARKVPWQGQAQPLLYTNAPAAKSKYSSGWACPCHEMHLFLIKYAIGSLDAIGYTKG